MNGVRFSPDGSYALLTDYKYLVRKIVITTAEVTTVAGRLSSGSTNGQGSNARFRRPVHLSFVSDGSYVLVTDGSNALIRKLVISTSIVTTVVGVSRVEGNTNGVGTNALLTFPSGISISPDDSFALITDYDSCLLRKYELLSRQVTTVAGGSCGVANGIGTNAMFSGISDVRISPSGLYALISDYSGNSIRKIILATGEISTAAGNEAGTAGFTNGYGTNAFLNGPYGVDISPDGHYALIAEYGSPRRVRHLHISTGSVTTFAGRYSAGITDGLGTIARFDEPAGVSISPNGSFALLADYGAYKLRYMDIVIDEPEDKISMSCPFYQTTLTSNATESTSQCTFLLCPFQVVKISSCATCNGDTLFRLYDSSGLEVAWNDDGVDCDKCSSLSFTYTKSSLYCELYAVHQGCSANEGCSGEAQITLEYTRSAVPKYGFGLIFGDPSILNMTQEGMLVNYHYNTPKSNHSSLFLLIPFPS